MKIIAITGEKRTGKSTLIRHIKDDLKNNSIELDGLLSLPVIENDQLEGFDLLQLKTNQAIPLARSGLESSVKTARFGFFSDAFNCQLQIVHSNNKAKTILLLDEIGILELRDLGWHNLVLDIKSKQYKGVVLVIRKSSFYELTKKYNLKYDLLVDLDSTDISLEMLKDRVINYLK